MNAARADIIAQLQRDLLPLQGYKPAAGNTPPIQLGGINQAFPGQAFPVGAVHEFLIAGPSESAAAAGFVMGIIGKLAQQGGITLWITRSRQLFPPGLAAFGIQPDKIIFLETEKELDCLWAMEEALKCEGLAAVVCETQSLSFTASRRFQLAVEQTGVTGFVLRHQPRNAGTTACIARWRISPLPGAEEIELPGIGFPRWNVELLKVRNGKPGSWQIEFVQQDFKPVSDEKVIEEHVHKKAG